MSLYDIAVAKAICGSGGGGSAQSGFVECDSGVLQASYNDLLGMVNDGVLPWTIITNGTENRIAKLANLFTDEYYNAIFATAYYSDGSQHQEMPLFYADDATSNLGMD